MPPFGLLVFMAVSYGAVVLVLLGFIRRVRTVEARLVRRRPTWRFVAAMAPFAVIACWSAFTRHTSHDALVAGYLSLVTILIMFSSLFRATAPTLTACAGLVCNLLAVSVNGLRMPTPGSCDESFVHTCTETATSLAWLSDWIVLDVRGAQAISAISPGDLLLTVGFALLAARIWLPLRATACR